jgi:hypothetical protein
MTTTCCQETCNNATLPSGENKFRFSGCTKQILSGKKKARKKNKQQENKKQQKINHDRLSSVCKGLSKYFQFASSNTELLC